MKFQVLARTGAIAAAMAAAGAARAQSVSQDINAYALDTGQYNLVVFGSATLNGSSDTEGGIAVGGSLAINGSWTIASQVSAGSNPSLYAAGPLSLAGTVYLNNGYASTPGLSSSQWSWNSTQKRLSSGSQVLAMNSSGAYTTTSPISNPAPANWVWSSVASNFASISAGLGRAAATGAISVSAQNLLFSTNQTSGVVVFSLDASQLSGNTYNGQTFSNLQINIPSGVNYVINVVNLASGQTLFGSGVNFNAGLNNGQLLWNFEGSSNFTISAGGNFYGSILAPASTITDNTTINGQVVASALIDQGVELHDTDFAVVSAVVPESRAFAGWAAGLCLAGVVFRRRLLRRRQRGRPHLT